MKLFLCYPNNELIPWALLPFDHHEDLFYPWLPWPLWFVLTVSITLIHLWFGMGSLKTDLGLSSPMPVPKVCWHFIKELDWTQAPDHSTEESPMLIMSEVPKWDATVVRWDLSFSSVCLLVYASAVDYLFLMEAAWFPALGTAWVASSALLGLGLFLNLNMVNFPLCPSYETPEAPE